ncbi:response regulator [Streptomyces alboniger]|uniref:Transcriptional regulatory protein n=1 Tax=Streptomyces alboniger TaxID=132473 RepID=A0A5J6HLB6_STRAD|nr:response regulator [Streptomyces alboniger]QEV17957.1 response regulator [Streptomyces alboniger]
MIDTLVVDDDFHVAEINARYVSRIPGFRVVRQVHDAASALAAVRDGGIDLVLLDHYMPGEDGLALTRRLRLQRTDVDVIMVTADDRPATVQEALRAGVLQYILKPFTFAGLRRKLEAYARLRTALDTTDLNQDDIDRVLGTLRACSPSDAMPKGFAEQTAELIRQVVARAPAPVSAQEVSEAARVSRSTAQRYLKFLQERGQLHLTLRYGAGGRPEHHYSTR